MHNFSIYHLFCLNTKPNINSRKSSMRNTALMSLGTLCFRSTLGSCSQCLPLNGKFPWNSMSHFNNKAWVSLLLPDRRNSRYCLFFKSKQNTSEHKNTFKPVISSHGCRYTLLPKNRRTNPGDLHVEPINLYRRSFRVFS